MRKIATLQRKNLMTELSNAARYPGLDPRTSKGITGKTGEI